VALDVAAERLMERIRLIRAVGDPALDRACIMSFVALLAGEFFTDRPKTASQVIRKFVIPLNDRIDDDQRQRLKPFAPRIIGTNDGHDAARAGLIFLAVLDDIVPAAMADGLIRIDTAGVGSSETSVPTEPLEQRRIHRNLANVIDGFHGQRFDMMAKEAGHLVAALAERTDDPARRCWYVDRAIDLLDRLCDVGGDDRAAASSAASAQPGSASTDNS